MENNKMNKDKLKLKKENSKEKKVKINDEKLNDNVETINNNVEIKINNKNKIFFCIKLLIIALFLSISVIFVVKVIKLNILPNKFLYLFIGILAFLNIIGALCLLIKKIWTKIISILFYLILAIASFFGIKYVDKTEDFLNEAFGNYIEETSTYYVIVKKDSKYETINDLDNIDLIYFTFYSDAEKIKENIQNKNSTINFVESNDLYTTTKQLLDDKITAIVIDVGRLDILDEIYERFEDQIKIIDTFDITSKVEIIETPPVEGDNNNDDENNNDNNNDNNNPDVEEPKKVSNEKINKGKSLNIYISGSDSRTYEVYNKSRSDVNMILTINPNTKTILITSIPRDYYVQIYGTTGSKDKLSYTGLYGLSNSTAVMKDLFNIEIDYSVKVGFNAVVEMVDLVEGIDVYSSIAFDSFHLPGWKVQQGMNHMDGKKALAYARERYAYNMGDKDRVLNQQQVFEATFKKVMSDKSILLKYEKLLDSLKKFYITDIPRSVISDYIKLQLDDMSSWKIIKQTVDGTYGWDTSYTLPTEQVIIMERDIDSINRARANMKQVLEGR